MAGEFELAGWSDRRIAPIGERWIEEYWRVVVRDLFGASPSKRGDAADPPAGGPLNLVVRSR